MLIWDNQPLQKVKGRYLKLKAKAEKWPYVVYYSAGRRWPKRSSFKIEKNAITKAAKMRMCGMEVSLRVYNKVLEEWSDWNDRQQST